MTTGPHSALDPSSDCRTDSQRAYWAERLQDLLDAGNLLDAAKESSPESSAHHKHLEVCRVCRETRDALLKADSLLQNHFAKAAHSPSLDFDAKLLARIGASEELSRAARQQREMQHYQTQLAQLKQSWRQLLGRGLSTSVGVLATLVVAMLSFGSSLNGAMHAFSGEANRLTTLVEKLGLSLLPVGAVFLSATIAALALWLTRRSDRHLS